MSKNVQTRLLKYGITGGICLCLAVFYCVARDFTQLTLVEKYRTLCDAFTIPGLLCLCVGVLIWASNDGFFYGLSYCLNVAWRALIPGARYKTERYYDYVTRKKEKRIPGYGFLFLVGGVCMAVAIVFLVLFYRIY
ncbi:MAG: DUF3899 domain-containing protein [Oscillospiraceae bacterium]|nr:DUF3899 domain-containing protein [Oscillospiraceae bacterium]